MPEASKTSEQPKPPEIKPLQFSVKDLLVLTTVAAACLCIHSLLSIRYADYDNGAFVAYYFSGSLFWLLLNYGILIKKQDHQGKKWMLRGGLIVSGSLATFYLVAVIVAGRYGLSISELKDTIAVIAIAAFGLFVGACVAFSILCYRRRQFRWLTLELIVLVMQLEALALFF